ncbi:MAG: GHKL domain-containing protein, partial [Lachnospiraceae bacterium]|nr:GHKL domain-containing protein [Lachnospiraceae bacterium]
SGLEFAIRTAGFVFLIHFIKNGRVLTWKAAAYYAIWAFMSWQLLYELWMFLVIVGDYLWINDNVVLGWIIEIGVFVCGFELIALTLGKWLPENGQKQIGPRQITLAFLTFSAFQLMILIPGNAEISLEDPQWISAYLAQILMAVILYLENELFKKSELRQEIEMMNLLRDNAREQYELARENISLINQKCHDLKHQIRALRNASREELEQYLSEIEDSIQIYEAIVKTGNEVLDTILTDKSLYCKERGITVSCVADGSQMDFINTIDLYAILGNAIDNAIEAVEKFEEPERRQIDVLVYRKQQFLAINVVNPMEEKLIFEDDLPVTTKKNKMDHGYGLKSINYILKKYDGALSISEEDGCFSLMLLIPIPMST